MSPARARNEGGRRQRVASFSQAPPRKKRQTRLTLLPRRHLLLTRRLMNLSEKRFSQKRASSRNQISVGLSGRSVVLAVAIMGWCVAVQGAEIHEAAELGDLERVKAYLSQDPKQIDLVDAKGRTVLARAARSGKQELVEFLLASGATEDIYAAVIVGHIDKVAAFLKQDKKLINGRDSGGKAALHWAALYGQKKAMELLLAEKADVNLCPWIHEKVQHSRTSPEVAGRSSQKNEIF